MESNPGTLPSKPSGRRWARALLALATLATPTLARAQGTHAPPPAGDLDFSDLSLEELMDIEVTSVSKKAQKVREAPAAVYVITQQELRRSGATTVADALRTVPGLEVARVNANRWAVSARGYNGVYADKLLVLVDGRSVYTPLYSGVYWDLLDMMLEDVERIEVIRGPGGARWGANAMNGVINIITRSSTDTQGGLVIAGAGTEERGTAAIRYGGRIDDDLTYRVWAKFFRRDDYDPPPGASAHDSWDAGRVGFRTDWVHDGQTLTVQGDLGYNHSEAARLLPTAAPPYSTRSLSTPVSRSGNVLTRWSKRGSGGSETSLQTYYDFTDRDDSTFREQRHTFDFDLQHAFEPWNGHSLLLGAGYRVSYGRFDGSPVAGLSDDTNLDELFNTFALDEIALADDWTLTLGAKLEHNDTTGFELQPDVRLLWAPAPSHTLWGAVSRSVRTPSVANRKGIVTFDSQAGSGGLPQMSVVYGNPNMKSEELLAYELGYRFRDRDWFSLDVATFFNHYYDVEAVRTGTPVVETTPVPRILVPLTFDNSLEGKTYGVETSAAVQVYDNWRLIGSYTLLRGHDEGEMSPLVQTVNPAVDNSPRHQVHLRSFWNVSPTVDLDVLASYVDKLPSGNADSYVRLDLRAAWRVTPATEAELVMRDLLDDRHTEFGRDLWTESTGIQRSVYFLVTHHF